MYELRAPWSGFPAGWVRLAAERAGRRSQAGMPSGRERVIDGWRSVGVFGACLLFTRLVHDGGGGRHKRRRRNAGTDSEQGPFALRPRRLAGCLLPSYRAPWLHCSLASLPWLPWLPWLPTDAPGVRAEQAPVRGLWRHHHHQQGPGVLRGGPLRPLPAVSTARAASRRFKAIVRACDISDCDTDRDRDRYRPAACSHLQAPVCHFPDAPEQDPANGTPSLSLCTTSRPRRTTQCPSDHACRGLPGRTGTDAWPRSPASSPSANPSANPSAM
ncbi:hypothetical protein P171DRAFT_417 [Karstenula rhodostoma CBS 690.94]|uniref:Uncharacterized protein n=1 Tax=Karstenula rhodostoma CBS 690.94 TaxID=1392251 RepID=A0A9P4PVR8_9PLEO|nr:hypothetical protein P171DRAFT_417 [Karstenula rhodostoma CBS 690.94]